MARIVIMGSGVVGTATGRGFAHAGHDVTFVDILPARVEALRREGLDARTAIELGDEPSFVFLTLPTPHDGRRYDLTAFDAGAAAVGRALGASRGVHTVVVRSTVTPGTTEDRVRPCLESASGKACDEGFELASNPEFLRAVSAADDFLAPWMTVVASRNPATRDRLAALLAPFGGELRVFDDPRTTEFIKCAHNIYNAAKISFWNEMWLVAQEVGVDLDEVSSTVARSAEGSFNPAYGIRGGAPYGGACLPKDTNGFLGFAAQVGVDMPLLGAVVAVNERLEALGIDELATLEAAGGGATVLDLERAEPASLRSAV